MVTSPEEKIVCKPTPWFTLRAAAMLVMFTIFGVYFAYDGAIGYRKKNLEYFVHKAFEKATTEFKEMNKDNTLTPEAWQAHAAASTVDFPEDRFILPADLEVPMKWPDELHKFDKVKSLNTHLVWQEYSGRMGYSSTPKEKPFDRGKLREQWICAVICGGLALVTLFFLLRTLRRSISADATGIDTQEGKHVPYSDLKTLDLRKWYTKGLAFADYEGGSGKGRIRIDGMTYGGFKEEDGQPGEKLIQLIRRNFTGELIEYAAAPTEGETKNDAANE